MNIQQQNGIISTINFTPYVETEEYQNLRKSLFDQATIASHITPTNHIDIFDESILVFKSVYQALSFLCHVFRSAVNLDGQVNGGGITLRSSLCFGDYFVHQDQIYGDAVNLATKLSYSSRQNEMLVCGIDTHIIEEFARSHHDIDYHLRDNEDNCVSINLLDHDSTRTKEDTRHFIFEFNGKSELFLLERCRKISIGRSENSDIFIDSDLISRNHATISLNFDSFQFEDHSSNGTYLYFDDRELFLTRETTKLRCDKGRISCGASLYSGNDSDTSNAISFMLHE